MRSEERLHLAEQTAALVLADWTTAGGSPATISVWLDNGAVCIWVNSGGTTPSAFAEDSLGLAVEVAEYVQSELINDQHRVLPYCTEHASGVHPKAVAGSVGWWCRPGSHLLASLGVIGRGSYPDSG